MNGDKFETDSYSNSTDGHQFLEFNSAILYTSKHQLFIVKSYVSQDYIRRQWHLRNILRVYVLGLKSVATLKNLLTINLEGQYKTGWSSLKIKQNIELVCYLWLHTILDFMIKVRLLGKIPYTNMLKNKLNRSLHQICSCCFDQVLVLGFTQFEQKCILC